MQAVLSSPPADLAALKQKQQAAWASGDYSVVGTTLQIVGESLAEAADVQTDEAVLDVAAGNGNATLAAARRGARVVSTDYVAGLLDGGRARANAERLPIEFQTADAEELPFPPSRFDAVLSTFGVMFTADHARAAREMVRVCKPGGRIAMANWTPEGFIGQLFKTLGTHLPPAPGAKSPALWGTEGYLKEIFGPGAASIQCTKRHFNFRYRSTEHFIDVFRQWYGPVHKAFGALGPKGDALAQDMTALMNRMKRSDAKTLVIPSEYLEVVVVRA
jgi:ubiquinone/menaquinone biosynthesis C-methylase UbiE